MTTHNIDFKDIQVETTQRSLFLEVALPIGADIIEIELAAGGVRLSGIAFGPDFDDDGAPLGAIQAYVPWKSGGAWLPISTVTAITVNDGQVVGVPYAEVSSFEKIRLVLTTPQTSATKLGVWGWTG